MKTILDGHEGFYVHKNTLLNSCNSHGCLSETKGSSRIIVIVIMERPHTHPLMTTLDQHHVNLFYLEDQN